MFSTMIARCSTIISSGICVSKTLSDAVQIAAADGDSLSLVIDLESLPTYVYPSRRRPKSLTLDFDSLDSKKRFVRACEALALCSEHVTAHTTVGEFKKIFAREAYRDDIAERIATSRRTQFEKIEKYFAGRRNFELTAMWRTGENEEPILSDTEKLADLAEEQQGRSLQLHIVLPAGAM